MSIALHPWLIWHKDAKSSLLGRCSSATEEAVVCWLVSLLEVKMSSNTFNDVSVNSFGESFDASIVSTRASLVTTLLGILADVLLVGDMEVFSIKPVTIEVGSATLSVGDSEVSSVRSATIEVAFFQIYYLLMHSLGS